MKTLRILLLLTVVAWMRTHAFGQAGIVITATHPSALTVCGGAATFTVQATNGTASVLNNVFVQVTMPPGMAYQANTVIGATDTNIGNLQSPVFALTGGLAPAATATLSYQAKASCPLLTYLNANNPAKNTILLSYNGGSVSFLTSVFNVLSPNLTMPNPATVTNAAVNDLITRTVTITNSGLGSVSSFELDINNNTGLTSIGSSPGIHIPSGNDAVVKIDSADLPGGILSPGAQFSFTITDRVNNCANLGSTYGLRWGCNTQTCTFNPGAASSTVQISTGLPNLVFSPSSPDPVCLGSTQAQGITVTNNGNGPATTVALRIFQARPGTQSDFSPLLYSTIVIGSITLTMGNTTVPWVPISTTANESTGDYACLGSNPKGEMLLALPTIPAGTSVVLHWDTYNCCPTATTFNGDFQNWGYDAEYSNACGNVTFDPAAAPAPGGGAYRSVDGPIEGPSDMNDGDAACFSFYFGRFATPNFPSLTARRLRFIFTLDPGLDTTSTPFYFSGIANPLSTTIVGTSQTGYTLTLEYAQGSSNYDNSEAKICLEANCNAGPGSKGIHMVVEYLQDPGCSTCVMNIADRTTQVMVHCPNPCLGLALDGFDLSRTNLATDFDPFFGKAKRAIYGDTLHYQALGVIHANSQTQSFRYGYFESAFSGMVPGGASNHLENIGSSASVRIYDASTGNTYNCTATPTLGNVLRINFSPHLLLGYIPPLFRFENGDTIWIEGDLRVKRNAGINLIQAHATTSMFVSNVQNPTLEADKYGCNTYGDNFSIGGYYLRTLSTELYNAIGCAETTLIQSYSFGIGPCCSNYDGGNFFPGETREFAILDSLQIALPTGYSLATGSTIRYNRTIGTNSISSTTVLLGPPSTHGDTLSFDIQHFYTNGDFLRGDDGWEFTSFIKIRPSCEVVPIIQQTIPYRASMSVASNLAPDTVTPRFDDSFDNIIANTPILNFVAPAPVQGITSTAAWILNLSHTATTNNAWISVTTPSGSMSNIVVRTALNGPPILPDPGSGLYTLGNMNGAGGQPLYISANYNSCSPDSLVVLAGWNCEGYPDSLAAAVCDPIHSVLHVIPQPGAMQCAFTTPVSPQPICTPFTYEVLINSSLISTLTNLIVDVVLPPNMSIVSGSELLYPITNFPTQAPATLLQPGIYRFDLNAISPTIQANGLPGGGVHLPQSQAILRFSLSPNCGFISGDEVQIQVQSINNCGDTLQNSFTHQPQIQGASTSNTSLMEVTVIDTLAACGNTGSILRMRMENLGPNTMHDHDSAYVELPLGLGYVPGSFTPLLNAGQVVVTTNPTTRLAVGVEDSLPVGGFMEFIVLLQNISLAHGQSAVLLAQSFASSHLYCATSGDTCTVLTPTGIASDTVWVFDRTPPIPVCQNATLQLDANGTANISLSQIDGGSTDDCGIAAMSINAVGFFCADIGPNTVTLTVMDIHGNSSSCTAIVTVVAPPAVVTLSSPINACGYNVSHCCNTQGGDGSNGSGHQGSDEHDGSGSGSDQGHGSGNGHLFHPHQTNGGHGTGSYGGHGQHGSGGSGSGHIGQGCGHDGCINIALTGGCNTNSFTYQWSNGSTTANQCGLAPGLYTLTITDAYGHTTTQSITLTQSTAFAATVSAMGVYCYNGHDGSATVSPQGGCPPYTYHWSTGANTSTVSGLAAGNYSVTVTDHNGCTATAQAIVTHPLRLQANAGSDKTVYPAYAPRACAFLNGSASGGSGSYTAVWTSTNGTVLGTGMNLTVCPTVATVYRLRVTDANGCMAMDSVRVCVANVSCGNNMIRICHNAPGHYANSQTQCIATGSVASHLTHGDRLGACAMNMGCGQESGQQGSTGSGSGHKGEHEPESSVVVNLSLQAFPNPTMGLLDVRLKCQDCNENASYRLRLTDLAGKVLLERKLQVMDGEAVVQLNLGDYAAGTYLLSVEGGSNGRLVQRIVKQ